MKGGTEWKENKVEQKANHKETSAKPSMAARGLHAPGIQSQYKQYTCAHNALSPRNSRERESLKNGVFEQQEITNVDDF